MNANLRNASKRTVSAIFVVSVIAAMLLALFPAMAGPGPIQATVMGTVTDINDGEPIEGALVVISYHGTERSMLTDEEGKYKFQNVPECYCLKAIKVTKDGYRPESEDIAVSGVTVVDFELLFMELEPYEGTVQGTVTDNHDGTPLQGVHVELQYHGIVRETYTDPEGKYAFERVPICYCLKKVTATLEHYRPESKEVGVQSVTVVDFQLWIEEQAPNMDGTVSGIVTDADTGEPIVGALVVVEHHGHLSKTVTDEAGQYTVTGIELCFCLKDIYVSADGYRSQEESIAVGEETVMNFLLEPDDDAGSITPVLPIRMAPEEMRDRPYIMAGLVAASVGLVAMGYYAYMARE